MYNYTELDLQPAIVFKTSVMFSGFVVIQCLNVPLTSVLP